MPKSRKSLIAFLREYDEPVCGRCLVVLNDVSAVRAKRDTGDGALETFPHPTDMLALKAWVIEKILDDHWIFEIDRTNQRFVPISTWGGDPVCIYHLTVLADMERRSYRW